MLRRFVIAVAFVGLVLPSVTAQADPTSTEVRVEVANFEEPLKPLADADVQPVTVHVPCRVILDAIAGGSGGVGTLALGVVDPPAWVVAEVSPATIPVNAEQCLDSAGSAVPYAATLSVATTEDAPAFEPVEVVVEAVVAGPGGRHAGTGTALVSADWFSKITATVEGPVRVVKPGAQTELPIRVVEQGNAAARVTFRIVNVTEGWQVKLPPPADAGPRGAEGVTTLTVIAPKGGGFQNDIGLVNLALESRHAQDRARVGDESMISVLLTAKGFDASTPAPPALALLVALGAGAAVVARRGAR